MSELCALLPWDSQHFGLICARALVTRLDEGVLRDISEWCREEKVELLFFLADDDVTTWKLAAETGFQLVDVRMRLTLDRSGAQGTGSLEVAPKLLLREARAADTEFLFPIAKSAYTDSRFFADPRIPRDRAGELYVNWLRESIEGKRADVVFTAELDGRPIAYIGVEMAEGEGVLGLLGIDETARGLGVGPALIERALEWVWEAGGSRVSVVTQGRNTVAQRVYQRLGFLTDSVQLWYHWWIPRSTVPERSGAPIG